MTQPIIHSTAKAVVPPTLRVIDILILCVGLSLTLPRVALGQSTTCIPLSAKKRTYAAHVLGGRAPRKDAATAAKRDGVVRGAIDGHRVFSMSDPQMCAIAADAFYAAFDESFSRVYYKFWR